MHYFSFAGGPGLALGLCATALARPAYAGLWLGCAVAAAPQFWFFPVILAAGFVAVRGFIPGMERIVIPAAAVAFVLLVIPVSHGGPPLPYSAGFTPTDSAFASAARTLRDRAGNQPVDIAASPTARPVLAFYRERYRQRNWAIGGKHPSYYLWLADEPKPVNVARPLVLFQRSGVVLAR